MGTLGFCGNGDLHISFEPNEIVYSTDNGSSWVHVPRNPDDDRPTDDHLPIAMVRPLLEYIETAERRRRLAESDDPNLAMSRWLKNRGGPKE